MSSAPYTANIASRNWRTGLVKFLQSLRSFEYSHLHIIYSSFITDINRSGEDDARGDRHGLSVRCGGNSRLSAVWKICALPYLLASHNNWTYSSFHPFAVVQLVRLFLWDVESFQWLICVRCSVKTWWPFKDLTVHRQWIVEYSTLEDETTRLSKPRASLTHRCGAITHKNGDVNWDYSLYTKYSWTLL